MLLSIGMERGGASEARELSGKGTKEKHDLHVWTR